MLSRCSVLLVLALAYAAVVNGGTLSMHWTTNKEPVSYRAGEPMQFELQLLDDGAPAEGKIMKWLRTGDDGQTAQGEAVSTATLPLTITTMSKQPGFVRLEISVFNEDGSPAKTAANAPVKFHGGAGAEPEKLKSHPEPADFDAFWKKQKTRLAAVPLKVRMKEVVSEKAGFTVFDVQVDCAGSRPVSGYLSIPDKAASKSLGAEVFFLGYGVTGSRQRFQPGMIVFQINAHGIENGREPGYYQALETGELKGYAFNRTENARPETAYFNGMMLRVLRALEYVKSRPEWNGRELVAAGGSQGAFQALTAAALDARVTRCQADIPWCADLGGYTFGRITGWRPEYTDALGYYDAVNMAKRIRCPVTIESRLGDYVCPPSGLSVLYNNIKTPKSITYIQGGTHSLSPKNATRQTLKSE
jgi:cephalosporin-C deacetylase-like acetyl esterase